MVHMADCWIGRFALLVYLSALAPFFDSVSSNSFNPQAPKFNQWQPFSNWSKNGPSQLGALYPTTLINIPELPGEQILMVSPDFQFDSFNTSTTWFYQVSVNSWFPLYIPTALIPLVQHYTLTTICESSAVLFGGHEIGRTDKLSNQTWIFDGVKKTWSQIAVQSYGYAIEPRFGHAAAPVGAADSPCACKESVVVFGGKASDGRLLGETLELRCIAEGVYRWDHLNITGTRPRPRYFHMAVATGNDSVYIAGGYSSSNLSDMWALTVSNSSWNLISSSLPCKETTENKETLGYSMSYEEKGVTSSYVMICCSQCPIVFNPATRELLYGPNLKVSGFTSLGPFPPGHARGTRNMTGAAIENTVVLLTDDARQSAWNMTFLPPGYVSWTLLIEPVASPTDFLTQKLTLHTVNFRSNLRPIMIALGSSDADEVWTFNLKSGQWYKSRTDHGSHLVGYYSAVALTSKRGVPIVVVYGGIQDHETPLNQTRGFYPWSSHWEVWNLETPGCRFLQSADRFSDQTILVFGGLRGCGGSTIYQPSNDMWNFTLLNEFDSNNPRGAWTLVTQAGHFRRRPSARFGHSQAIADGKVIIYGGLNETNEEANILCFNDMWVFSVFDSTWTELPMNPLIYPGRRCFHSVAAFGSKMLLSGGCLSLTKFELQFITENCIPAPLGVWMFELKQSNWISLIKNDPINPSPFSSLTIWTFPDRQFAVAAGGSSASEGNSFFTVFKTGCPSGYLTPYFTEDFLSRSCEICQAGTYSADTGACVDCPKGLSSNKGSDSLLNCSRCYKSCDQGTCIVDGQFLTLGRFQDAALCHCKKGWTRGLKGKCNLSESRVIGGSLGGGLFLFAVAVVTVAYFWRSQKKKFERIEWDRSWLISYEHLQKIETLGNASRSAEVQKAEYGGKSVAVKTLVDRDVSTEERLSDIDEVNEMLRLQHPNIVRLIGVGFRIINGKNCPFIVMDWFETDLRQKILARRLANEERMRFARDLASGLHYMHNLAENYPKFSGKKKKLTVNAIVHMDLKPDNLFIRGKCIKIADFGIAMVVQGKMAGKKIPHSKAGNYTEPDLKYDRLSNTEASRIWSKLTQYR